jgi:hypothetical protein
MGSVITLKLRLEDLPDIPAISGGELGGDWGIEPSTWDVFTASDPVYTDPAALSDYEAQLLADQAASDAAASGATADYSAEQQQQLATDTAGLSAQELQSVYSSQDPIASAQWYQQFNASTANLYPNMASAIEQAGYDPNFVGLDQQTGNIYQLNQDGSQGQILAYNQNGSYVPAVPVLDAQGNATGQFMPAPAGSPTTTQSGWISAVNAALAPVASLLASPIGKLLGTAAVGALGLGAQALFAGNVAKVPAASTTIPANANALLQTGQGAALAGLTTGGGAAGLTQAVGTGLQGQGTLADLLKLQATQQLGQQTTQQPLEAGVARQAVEQLPGQMNATTNPNITGTAQLGQAENRVAGSLVPYQQNIGQGLGTSIQNVLAGQYSNPILQNQIKMARDAFNAKMYAQLGPGWETSTPGMQAKEQQDLLEQSLQFQDKQQTLASYTPLFNSTMQNSVGNQSQATGQVQQAQAQGVNQNAALSNLGKTSTNTLATGLQEVAPASAYSGIQSASQAQQQLIAGQQQANLTNTANTNTANQSLATGIGNVTGLIGAGISRL